MSQKMTNKNHKRIKSSVTINKHSVVVTNLARRGVEERATDSFRQPQRVGSDCWQRFSEFWTKLKLMSSLLISTKLSPSSDSICNGRPKNKCIFLDASITLDHAKTFDTKYLRKARI